MSAVRLPLHDPLLTARALRNQFQLDEGNRLVQTLQRRGVPSVVIKGPALSRRLFASQHRRDHVDIDLVVPPEFLNQAVALLAAEGYALELPDLRSPVFRGPCQCVLRKAAPLPASVELHWRLYPRHLPFPRKLELDSLWPRLEAGGMVFDDNDLALYLAFHWVKEWQGAQQLEMFAAALAACRDFPWPAAVADAEREGTLRPLLTAALAVHRRYESNVPAWVLMRAETDTQVAAHAERALRAFADGAKPASEWELFRYSWTLLTRARDRARLAWYSLMAPTLADYRAWPLPPRWHGIYFLSRPVRLLWRHSLGVPSSEGR
jgi:hypothetical protein